MEHTARNTAGAQGVAASPFLQPQGQKASLGRRNNELFRERGIGEVNVREKITERSLAQSTRAGT